MNRTVVAEGIEIRRLRALADDTRMSIVRQLAGRERCVCELTTALELGQSLLSFHLRVLKEAELVRDRRAGRWVYYRLNRGALGDVEALLRALREADDPSDAPAACCE